MKNAKFFYCIGYVFEDETEGNWIASAGTKRAAVELAEEIEAEYGLRPVIRKFPVKPERFVPILLPSQI